MLRVKKKSNSGQRLDAVDTAFVSRSLEYIKKKVYEVKYAELMARRFVPPASDPAPAGAEVIRIRQTDRRGMFKLISGYAQDLPRIDLIIAEAFTKVVTLGASIGWNRQEQRAAQYAGVNLSAEKMNAARRAYEETIDEILTVGIPAVGLTGLINNVNVPTGSVTGGTWATKALSDPDAILDDVSDMLVDLGTATVWRERPNTLLLPPEQFALVSLTRLIDQNITVLQFMREALAPLGITAIEPWWRLKGAGAGLTDRMVMYKRDPENVYYELPMPFTMHEEQWVGLEVMIPIECRVGGVVIPFPLSLSYRDGI